METTKMYLVQRNTMDETNGLTIINKLFREEKNARKYFEELVTSLECDYDQVVGTCVMSTNNVSFYNEGSYNEWHDDVSLEEISIQD